MKLASAAFGLSLFAVLVWTANGKKYLLETVDNDVVDGKGVNRQIPGDLEESKPGPASESGPADDAVEVGPDYFYVRPAKTWCEGYKKISKSERKKKGYSSSVKRKR